MKKIKLLFFTPYAGYTGSEMMLWYLLSGLDRDKFEIKLYSGRNGELLQKFPAHISVQYSDAGKSIFKRAMDKLLKKLKLPGIEERQILKLHEQFKPDYWYINTMTMNYVTDIAIFKKIKYVVHFHELLMQYASVSSAGLKNMVANAFFSVGCSEKVCQNLKTLGAKNIFRQYECVDFSRIQIRAGSESDLRKKHNISADRFLIVMSGQRIERKGFDLFIEAAIRSKKENYHFLWLGSSKNCGYEFFLESCIKEQELKNISIIAPANNEYYDYLNTADLFFLTSREDPFPLVMLEAAYLGKPILAFDSGGSKEFVSSEVGTVLDEITQDNVDKGIAQMKKAIDDKKFRNDNISEHAKKYDVKKQTMLFENWLLQNLAEKAK